MSDCPHPIIVKVWQCILCQSCNSALAMVRDDPERLRKLAAYLEEQ